MKNFNQFNLNDRPVIDIGDFTGSDGNSFILAAKYKSGMKSAGYEEESLYLGGKSFSEYSNGKFELLQMDRQFIENIVFSLAETNYEIEEKNKNDDEDMIIVIKKKKKASFNPDEINYLGRGSHYYATTETMKDEILKHYDHFLEKDKVGMTVLDHYILSEKYSEYALAVQFILINYLNESYEDAFNNKVFGLNILDNIGEKNSLLMLHTNLAKYTLTGDEEIAKESVEKINARISHMSKNRQTSMDDKISFVKEIFNATQCLMYLSSHVEDINEFNSIINSGLMTKDSQFIKFVNDTGNKELIVELERNLLMGNVMQAMNKMEVQDDMKITRRRI